MNKLLTILGLFLGFTSCDNTIKEVPKAGTETLHKSLGVVNDTVNVEQKTFGIDKENSKVIPDKTKYENFEIVSLDFNKGRLQRVFAVLDTLNIYDTVLVQSIICQIQAEFDIDNRSNISFFSEKKYADYKNELFIMEGHSCPIDEYDNWRNYYYLAEYDFEISAYKTYPACQKKYQRQQTIKIECK